MYELNDKTKLKSQTAGKAIEILHTAPVNLTLLLHSLRYLACALLCVVLVDYAQSGALRVKDVKFGEEKHSQSLVVSLPFKTPAYEAQDTYSFDFHLPASLLNQFFPLRLIPGSCFHEITINGRPVPLEHFSSADLCDGNKGIPIDDFKYLSSPQINVTIEGKSTFLSLERQCLFSPGQRIFILTTAAWLFTLGYARTREQRKRLHYTWLVCAIFAFSFFVQHRWLP